jgi:hypothetical protein
MPVLPGYFSRMKILLRIMAGLALLVSVPSYAIVGGGAPSAQSSPLSARAAISAPEL